MVDRRKTPALFPTETITRGTHHRKSTRREQDFNLYKLDLTLMKFCSSDNLYTTAPQVFFPFSIIVLLVQLILLNLFYWFLYIQVIGVHQETVEAYLTNIITGAVEITAEEQARAEVEEMAAKINQVAYEMEKS